MGTWNYPKDYAFTDEDVQLNIRMTQDRIHGRLSEEEWDLFLRGLDILSGLPQGSKISAHLMKYCHDVFRCSKTDSHVFKAIVRKVGRDSMLMLWKEWKYVYEKDSPERV